MTQAQYLETLLVELLQNYDSTLDLSANSTLQTEVVRPLVEALGADPVSTDSEKFILSRLREQHPELSLQDGDSVVDLLVRPMQVLLEGFRRELAVMRRGQNLANLSLVTLEQAEDLASNFFVTRKVGQRAAGLVRVFFANPTYVSLAENTEFFTATGLAYTPVSVYNISPQRMLNQRSGSLYYIDVSVQAIDSGSQYNIPAGAIVSVSNLTGAVRVANLVAFSGGVKGETSTELLTRAGYSLTERSLTTKKGIRAQLLETFKGLKSLQVIGYGDPEMTRDTLTGTSVGKLRASGMSMVVGSYVFMISMYEDNGPSGSIFAKEGNLIDLNFSKLFYDIPNKNQRFTIEEVVYSSENSLTNIPTVYILRLDRSPDVLTPNVSSSANLIPGALPGVFASIFGDTEIQISTGPDLIDSIVTDEVSLGGKVDVLVQPTNVSEVEGVLQYGRSEEADFESLALATSGSVPADLTNISKANIVASNYYLDMPAVSSFPEGSSVMGASSGAHGVISAKSGSGTRLFISTFNGISFQAGEALSYLDSSYSENISAVHFDDLEDAGVKERSALHILSGTDAGAYKVLFVEGAFAYLSQNLVESRHNLSGRFVSKTKVNIFNPSYRKYPFPSGEATGLQTTIGLHQVTVKLDLQAIGIIPGDTLELLDGPNKGVYTISAFGSQAGFTPVLSSPMAATDSNVNYIVYSETAGLESPMVRILPQGITASGQVVPYAKPVGAVSLEGFSGARSTYYGVNGFVLPDPGPQWKPATSTYASSFSSSELQYMESLGGGVTKCFTENCHEEGEDLVCKLSLVSNPVGLYLEGAITSSGTDYLQYLRSYLLGIVQGFDLGQDLESFIKLFGPVNLGSPPAGAVYLKQYEILLPRELYDSYNNVFVAIPEFDWQSEFDSEPTFQGAVDKLNEGTMVGRPPALIHAQAGDCFTIPDGPNKGSYRIAKISKIKLFLESTLLTAPQSILGIDETKAYDIAIVVIEGEFPHTPAKGLSDFFDAGITTPTLPQVPAINYQTIAQTTVTTAYSTYQAGDVVGTFEVVQGAFTWMFQFLHQIGFDVDSNININVGPTLQKIVQKLFHKYYIGNQSCLQDVRFFFQDPCEIEFRGSRSSRLIEWNRELQTPAAVFSVDLASSGPITGLTTITALVKMSESAEVVSLTASTTDQEMATAYADNGWDSMVEVLQEGLDPDQDYIRVYYVSPTTNTRRLAFELVSGGQGTALEVSTNSSASLFLVDVVYDQGASSAASTLEKTSIAPTNPTVCYATAEQTRMDFAAKLGPEDYIFLHPANDSEVGSLPRDLLIGSEYSGSNTCTATSLEDEDSWFVLGARIGDELHMYEQKHVLDVPANIQSNLYAKSDRVLIAVTSNGSTSVDLLESSFGFTSPQSGNDSDTVLPGDLLCIEDGPSKGIYSILRVSEKSLVLSEPMKSGTPAQVVRSGYSGSVSAGSSTFRPPTAFTQADVGRYLTIYGSYFSDTDGSYEITSVDSSGQQVELDTPNFEYSDSDLYWAVTKIPLESPADSQVEGRSSTSAGYPIRLYSGTPKKMPIVDISKDLSRLKESVVLYHGDSSYPRASKNPPYRIVRTHSRKATPTEMASSTALGLYYADCPSTAITPDLVSNIPAYTPLMPLLRSIQTKGYVLSTTDETMSYSTKEECFLIADSVWDPGSGDLVLETKDMVTSFEISVEASAVQAYMNSRDNRVVCSDPLVRSFCPSYIYMFVTASGGEDVLSAAEDIKYHIESLNPEDPVVVSHLEKYLHSNGVANYQHPIYLVALTHDLDRNIVMTLDQDRINDATLNTKVTNRTTYYITGEATSSSSMDGSPKISISNSGRF